MRRQRGSRGGWAPVWVSVFLLFPMLLSGGSRAEGGGGPIDNAWELTPLVLKDLDGERRSLYDWHGKVIVLNFWATWCRPCQVEIPDLIRYQREYRARGLQVVSVGIDELRKLRNFARTVRINYPVLVADPEDAGALLQRWGDSQGILPFTVVIGRDGHLAFMRMGMFDDEAFESYVLPLLSPSQEQT